MHRPVRTNPGVGHEKGSSFRCRCRALRRTGPGSAKPHGSKLGRPSPRRHSWPSQHACSWRGRRARGHRHEGSSPDHAATCKESQKEEGKEGDLAQNGDLSAAIKSKAVLTRSHAEFYNSCLKAVPVLGRVRPQQGGCTAPTRAGDRTGCVGDLVATDRAVARRAPGPAFTGTTHSR